MMLHFNGRIDRCSVPDARDPLEAPFHRTFGFSIPMRRHFALTPGAPPKRATEAKQGQNKQKKTGVKPPSRDSPRSSPLKLQAQAQPGAPPHSSPVLEAPSPRQRPTPELASPARSEPTVIQRGELLARYSELAEQYAEALSQRDKLLDQEKVQDREIARAFSDQVAMEEEIRSKPQSHPRSRPSTT
jgi:hypothetical protein